MLLYFTTLYTKEQLQAIVNIILSAAILGDFAKLPKSDYLLRHICFSVRPHSPIRLPLDGFS